MDNIKSDIDELKADHKEIKKFVDEQKNLYKYVWAAGSLLLGLLYFAKDIYEFIGKLKGNH